MQCQQGLTHIKDKTMFNLRKRLESLPKSKLPLSWDIANPLLPWHIQIQEDVTQLKKLIKLHKWELDLDYNKLLAHGFSIVITNLQKEIIWVCSNFLNMTGYTPKEAIGQKPSFLQGARTNKKQVELISEQLKRYETVSARLINYRKDNEPYLCEIKIYPLKNTEGQVTHFLAIEKDKDE